MKRLRGIVRKGAQGVQKALFRLTEGTPLGKALRSVTMRGVTLFTYHAFTDANEIPLLHRYLGRNAQAKFTQIDSFTQHLDFITQNFQVLSLSEILSSWMNQKALPAHTAALTIDDGYASVYRLAYPLLVSRRVPATVFLVSDFIDGIDPLWMDQIDVALHCTQKREVECSGSVYTLNTPDKRAESNEAIRRFLKSSQGSELSSLVHSLLNQLAFNFPRNCSLFQPLSWDQIREMHRSGLITFGSHSKSHPVLSRCSKALLETEAGDSKRRIEEELKAPCSYFCYPFGTEPSYNNEVIDILKACAYECAVTTEYGFADAQDPFRLKRIGITRQIHGALELGGMLSLGETYGRFRSIYGSLIRRFQVPA